MIEWIASGHADAAESAWMAAAEGEQAVAPGDAAAVLAKLVEANLADQAEAMAWALLEERKPRLSPEEALSLAKALAQAVPASAELRDQALAVYRLVYGQHEHFDVLIRASDLMGGTPPRRAFATLDLCLRVHDGTYLANQFQNIVVQVKRYDVQTGEYELEDLAGGAMAMEPRKLGDEYAIVEETDFRVLARRDPQRVREVFETDPAGVLIGICKAHDGRIDANGLKELLIPRYLDKEAWSGWWGRARAAANRSDKLTVEGRSPIRIVYHPRGKSLEDELETAWSAVRTPQDALALLRTYAREARQRKLGVREEFARKVTTALSDQAKLYAATRPADALVAALGLVEAERMNLPPGALPAERPSPREILATAPDPVRLASSLEDESLWAAAAEALSARPDGPELMVRLLECSAPRRIEKIASLLSAAGRADAVASAASSAVADPLNHMELCLWLWGDSPQVPRAAASRLELLTRLLKFLHDLEVDPSLPVENRREVQRQVRAALSVRDYAGFREVMGQVDEAMASIIKKRVDRGAGLASTVRDDMLKILREHFFHLFAKPKIDPWLDESVIYTTQAGLNRYEGDYKHLVDVLMPANSRAIGAAAERGDLSENSEWKFAVEQRNEFQARQAKMQDELVKARVRHPEEVHADSVDIGSKVTLRRIDGGGEVTISILGPWDTDVRKRIYSYQTGLAARLMGLPVGAKVAMKLDADEVEYEIAALGVAEGM